MNAPRTALSTNSTPLEKILYNLQLLTPGARGPHVFARLLSGCAAAERGEAVPCRRRWGTFSQANGASMPPHGRLLARVVHRPGPEHRCGHLASPHQRRRPTTLASRWFIGTVDSGSRSVRLSEGYLSSQGRSTSRSAAPATRSAASPVRPEAAPLVAGAGHTPTAMASLSSILAPGARLRPRFRRRRSFLRSPE